MAIFLTRLMCMTAENPELQARLRKEILDARVISTPLSSYYLRLKTY